MAFIAPFSWEFHHPSWRTPSFFRGVGLNHQPVKFSYSYHVCLDFLKISQRFCWFPPQNGDQKTFGNDWAFYSGSPQKNRNCLVSGMISHFYISLHVYTYVYIYIFGMSPLGGLANQGYVFFLQVKIYHKITSGVLLQQSIAGHEWDLIIAIRGCAMDPWQPRTLRTDVARWKRAQGIGVTKWMGSQREGRPKQPERRRQAQRGRQDWLVDGPRNCLVTGLGSPT